MVDFIRANFEGIMTAVVALIVGAIGGGIAVRLYINKSTNVSSSNRVRQDRASAGGDNVGRDKTTHTHRKS